MPSCLARVAWVIVLSPILREAHRDCAGKCSALPLSSELRILELACKYLIACAHLAEPHVVP